jgi:hypothetical protein
MPTGPTGGGITIGGTGGCTGGTGGAGGNCMVAQPASTSAVVRASRLQRVDNCESLVMWILFLEAAVAFCVLVFIVWWTMFSGRK